MDESNLIENGGFMDRGDAEVLCSRVWDGDGTHKKSFSHALVLGKREDGALFVRDARTVRDDVWESLEVDSFTLIIDVPDEDNGLVAEFTEYMSTTASPDMSWFMSTLLDRGVGYESRKINLQVRHVTDLQK